MVGRLTLNDWAIARELFAVSHLVKPRAALFTPAIAVQVARLALGDALANLAGRCGPNVSDHGRSPPAASN